MAEAKTMRLNKVLREFNISLDRAVEFLNSKGHDIEARPTAKISQETYQVLFNEFQTDKSKKVASKEVGEERKKEKEELRLAREREQEEKRKEQEKKEQEKLREEQERKKQEQETLSARTKLSGPKTVGKIDLDKPQVEKKKEEPKKEEKPEEAKQEKPAPKPVEEKPKPKPDVIKGQDNAPKKEQPKEEPKKDKEETQGKPEASEQGEESNRIKTNYTKLDGPNFTGEKIDLSKFKKPVKKKDDKKTAASNDDKKGNRKKRRRRISKDVKGGPNQGGGNNNNNNRKGRNNKQRSRPITKEEPSEEEVQKQVRETLEKLQGKSSKGKGAKYRRDKRDQHRQRSEEDLAKQESDSKVLKVTEFVTVSEVATMMDVPVTKVISACMSLGMMVTMNQRLDAETLSIVADEFGYEVDFVTADVEETVEVQEDAPEDLQERAPIVTVMGHVDHGKTSLLDYIRKENVIAGESGGITQHIGAYGVELDGGQKIAFLDTPGHEAFTAMRARGAQVTDIAIIVIAADDDVMPQTKEAISHAQAAGVPIIFAINKSDLPTANPEKIKEKLASMNLLVEDWGGKVQSHDISAKTGMGVKELLEKVLLEAEILELKANPNKIANGTVVEAFLDRGRGYVATILVQAGTLKIGDYVLAGRHSGKIKAMHDERGHEIKEAGPSTPVSILGLDGAPQAGDKFKVMLDEREAKDIAAKRTQLQREQNVRTQRHITLDEIGRRIALGEFKELNIILKGDVDGSVEALTDSFQKLSTEEIQVNIIHKGVGAITESDVLLASASDAIIIGFNVRPAGNARQVADKEEIDIRTYSIIYDAINDLKDAMEGMLSPEVKEEITGTAEIRETFKISKIGTIAGCMVTSGKIYRTAGVRLIRDGVVIYTGELASLKRFKDDVKEVSKGYDCGMQVKNYNDIREGDVIEAFREVEVKKTLK
ncbi:MAG: translation initiation factor IF-2 [Zunongwangia sp.]|uniref:Translation initiation factor IF-2 n=1 Tax=Zunongwangia profunda TaxID=398743 RepID=A0A3D5J2G3_9FLAO|nr:translation initiation factor IF-2 [Zunongwangia profunda]MAC66276.1 translation initiation factor IF-2 [Flavobacteriaceae bacterium]MAO37959.1 translation initiation factor IF-2 [Zunongwangia sp.]MAS72492.1 translation initiation factor IF-2 [Zunongwangia sp.]MCC4227294.1 translation initiation factor IF-2 [Zunongwangia profunda]HCV81520.1 translation initiation factor IF-2 [Zunongwangia profunda]|tara:strand:+ start:28 stop:2838 length:2811 start_codon:yes stop_codon:yes gene_type:complete